MKSLTCFMEIQMNRFLLDTHTFLWWLMNSKQLGSEARSKISNPDFIIFVSAVSIWEISIKKKIGKLEAPDNITNIVDQKGFEHLPISLFHGESILNLPSIHKDPFDRMLIVQAQLENLIIITNDDLIQKYNVNSILASE